MVLRGAAWDIRAVPTKLSHFKCTCREISTNSAINRVLRRSGKTVPRERDEGGRTASHERQRQGRAGIEPWTTGRARVWERPDGDPNRHDAIGDRTSPGNWVRWSPEKPDAQSGRSRTAATEIASRNPFDEIGDEGVRPYAERPPRSARDADSNPERLSRPNREPISIPYTTPASDFIYGTSAVTAAVRAGRRKLYKLYLHPRADRKSDQSALNRAASAAGVAIKKVDNDWLSVMDRMSDGRPHNVGLVCPFPCSND